MTPTVNSIRYLRDCTGNELVRQYVTFHVFFSNKHIPSKEKGILYPVNVARNIAREAALTHYILPSDIELYPSPNLPPRFLNMIARNAKPLTDSKNPRVFPISIFEVDAKSPVPLSKTQLKAMLGNKTAIPFHKFVCPYCHRIPQSEQWMSANETTRNKFAHWEPIFIGTHQDPYYDERLSWEGKNDKMTQVSYVFHVGKRHSKFAHWEPIFIGTHQDPYYDERLSWEGKNDKMTQVNYDFMILNNAFLTHKPGIKHYKKDAKRDKLASKQTSMVKKVIMPELKKLYGARSGCSL
ncbi:N-acetyl lactosaminide beta-1,3-N-acetyl glucosaminyl transferase [Operophtera brumata]|uniref:N-acetyl lactosaminide beta-1,3-N-acetyl glucosaminyl transferase n=1 Tax=Operophtera brumata TaxID=104452 RepID=A0A0L7KN68_OPEBR|nr:N-acetyl lactosaminide beta-1,3-N-acetyl glucosaminyl transferase [Operophtera brumata]